MLYDIPLTRLDDGQVIQGKLSNLSQHQIISLANQFMRNKRKPEAHYLMQYQNKKFIKSDNPILPESA